MIEKCALNEPNYRVDPPESDEDCNASLHLLSRGFNHRALHPRTPDICFAIVAHQMQKCASSAILIDALDSDKSILRLGIKASSQAFEATPPSFTMRVSC